jgi:hypothetical protein
MCRRANRQADDKERPDRFLDNRNNYRAVNFCELGTAVIDLCQNPPADQWTVDWVFSEG